MKTLSLLLAGLACVNAVVVGVRVGSRLSTPARARGLAMSELPADEKVAIVLLA